MDCSRVCWTRPLPIAHLCGEAKSSAASSNSEWNSLRARGAEHRGRRLGRTLLSDVTSVLLWDSAQTDRPRRQLFCVVFSPFSLPLVTPPLRSLPSLAFAPPPPRYSSKYTMGRGFLSARFMLISVVEPFMRER